MHAIAVQRSTGNWSCKISLCASLGRGNMRQMAHVATCINTYSSMTRSTGSAISQGYHSAQCGSAQHVVRNIMYIVATAGMPAV